ncbi:class I SAM-dependent methyltransferase family protein, partial [Candidatus Woesearchaeota archaeon]|nr:class I SAM-dependent methyltransferase family protein [Candidatus Woesearchaeota archaeon]
MLTIKVPLRKAEKLKNYLLDKCFFNKEHEIIKDKNFIYFPINEKKDLKKKFPFIEFVSKELKGTHKLTINELLKDKLTKKELSLVPSAFDIIGDIIILEIKQCLVKKEKFVAEAFLKLNKNIKTVVKKEGIHKGIYRVQKLKVLAGISKKETIYKENNVKIKLDVEKVYFSPRLSSERKRIMKLIKPDESILVMFSGCGPYPLVLSRNTKAKEIYGVEINPIAHKYALENLKLNKLNNVSLYCGDV